MSVFYEELTPQEFTERIKECPVGYLPLGTLEWHGPHLPLGTDAFEGKDLFRLAAEKFGGIVFPELFLGPDRSCEENGKEYFGMDMYIPILRCEPYPLQQFPGSCYHVPDEIYRLILLSIMKQAARAGFKVICGSGHGPSFDLFMDLAGEVKEKYGITLLGPDMDRKDLVHYIQDHAAKSETSNIMYFHPELVHMENLSPDPKDFPKGVSGADPRTEASAEYTAQRIPVILDRLGRMIREALKNN